jgi:hypothetical protein
MSQKRPFNSLHARSDATTYSDANGNQLTETDPDNNVPRSRSGPDFNC